MEKTKKAQAIKKLQDELKGEKAADAARYARQLGFASLIQLTPKFARRKEITLERRKAAEERKRAEELKAQVSHCRNRPWRVFLTLR